MQHFLVLCNDQYNYINACGIFIDKICQHYFTIFLKNSVSSCITIILYLTPLSLIFKKKVNKYQLIQKAAR